MGENARWGKLDWKLFEKNGELGFQGLGKDCQLW